MSNQEVNWNLLLSELLKYNESVSRLDELLNNQDDFFENKINNLMSIKESVFENKLNSQQEDIKQLENELALFNEIIEKTKEYLLLELESILDKQAIVINKHEDVINNLDERFNFVKSTLIDKEDKIDSLNRELGKFKQIVFNKDDCITNLE